MTHWMLCIDGLEENGVPAPKLPEKQLKLFGTVRTVPEGDTADSLGCILRLLGTPEYAIPDGRAAMEARAKQIPLTAQDAAFRCTLCALDEQGAIQPVPEGTQLDIAQLDLPADWTLYAMSGYRALLCIKQGAAALQAVKTYPPHQYFGKPLQSVLPQGDTLGQALRDFVLQSAQKLQGKVLLPWGQSAPAKLESFAARTGKQGALICQTEIVRGIALSLQMDCPTLSRATADIDTDLRQKYEAAIEAAQHCAFVCIHVNGCDEAAHRRAPAQKQAFWQRIYDELCLPLYANLSPQDGLLICSDHRASTATGAHEPEPVHYWLYQAGCAYAQEYHFLNTAGPLEALLKTGET